MKKLFVALHAGKISLAGRTRHIVIHAVRSALIMSAASLLFACGSGNRDGSSTLQDAQSSNAAVIAQAALPIPAACSDVATIAAGMYHTVGVKKDGTAVAVGYNYYGQLNVSSWTKIKAIAADTYHTVGLNEDGTVAAVGYNKYGQLDVSSWTKIKAIAAGNYHTIGLKEDGTVVAAGYNNYGQLNVISWTNIKGIEAGAYHTVGIKEDGSAVAVGNNNYGQMNVSSWANIKALAAGWYHTVGLKEDGTVVAAGHNLYGQLNVSSWTNIKAIAAGAYHTVALNGDGTVVAAGYNNAGQLNVSSWTNIKAIAAGAYHTVGLKEDGTVVAVGNNVYGQLDVSPLFTNIMPICAAVSLMKIDATPPVTTATVTGTQGNNGWYVSDVQMTLTATDNDGGSGVQGIHYNVDGVDTVVQGSSASYSIAGDGTHTVTWFAADNGGNAETSHQMIISIDKTPPSIPSLSASPSILWPPNHKMTDVLIGGYASDSGSGIASAKIIVNDEYGIHNMTIPGIGNANPFESLFAGTEVSGGASTITAVMVDTSVDPSAGTILTITDAFGNHAMTVPGNGNAISLEPWRAGSDMDGRVYTITAVIIDNAGNQSTGTTTVLVPHDMSDAAGSMIRTRRLER